MTFNEVILHFMINLRLYSVSIHFYQNRIMNECKMKKKAKIPEFLVRYRRTYVLNNILFVLKIVIDIFSLKSFYTFKQSLATIKYL